MQKIIFFFALIFSLTPSAYADLIPPPSPPSPIEIKQQADQQKEQEERPLRIAHGNARLNAYPRQYDSIDYACVDRAINASCTIGGKLYDGSGSGLCKSQFHDDGLIYRTCVRGGEIVIHNIAPNNGYTEYSQLCGDNRQYIPRDHYESPYRGHDKVICIPISTQYDQSCKGQAVDSRCQVLITLGDREETIKGICRLSVENRTKDVRKLVSCVFPPPVEPIYLGSVSGESYCNNDGIQPNQRFCTH